MNVFAQKLVKGGGVSGVLKLAGVGLAFLFFLIAARVTTPEQYGQFASSFSLATILGFFVVGGQHMAILRFWPSLDEQSGRKVADAALRFCIGNLAILTAAFVASGLAFWLIDQPRQLWSPLVAWTIVLSVAFALSEFTAAALRARDRIVTALAPREVLWRLLAIGAILALSDGYDGADLLAIAALTLLATLVFQIPQIVRAFIAARGAHLLAAQRSQIRHTSLGMWAGTALGPISSHVGTVIVGIALGPTYAGAYFAADRLAKLLSIALIGINQIVGPMISRSFHAGRVEEVKLISTAASLIAFVIALVGFAGYLVLGRWALSLFDESFRAFYPVLLILAIGQLANTICGPNTMLMNMVGLERVWLRIIVVWTGIGIPAVYLAATTMGITGAATASALIMVGWNLSSWFATYRHAGLLPISFSGLPALLRGARGETLGG